jgi:hypothetical protein
VGPLLPICRCREGRREQQDRGRACRCYGTAARLRACCPRTSSSIKATISSGRRTAICVPISWMVPVWYAFPQEISPAEAGWQFRGSTPAFLAYSKTLVRGRVSIRLSLCLTTPSRLQGDRRAGAIRKFALPAPAIVLGQRDTRSLYRPGLAGSKRGRSRCIKATRIRDATPGRGALNEFPANSGPL